VWRYNRADSHRRARGTRGLGGQRPLGDPLRQRAGFGDPGIQGAAGRGNVLGSQVWSPTAMEARLWGRWNAIPAPEGSVTLSVVPGHLWWTRLLVLRVARDSWPSQPLTAPAPSVQQSHGPERSGAAAMAAGQPPLAQTDPVHRVPCAAAGQHAAHRRGYVWLGSASLPIRSPSGHWVTSTSSLAPATGPQEPVPGIGSPPNTLCSSRVQVPVSPAHHQDHIKPVLRTPLTLLYLNSSVRPKS